MVKAHSIQILDLIIGEKQAIRVIMLFKTEIIQMILAIEVILTIQQTVGIEISGPKINIANEINCNKFSMADTNCCSTNLTNSRSGVHSDIEIGKLCINNSVNSKNLHINRVNIKNTNESDVALSSTLVVRTLSQSNL